MSVSLSLGMRRLLLGFGLLGLVVVWCGWATGAEWFAFMGKALAAMMGMGG